MLNDAASEYRRALEEERALWAAIEGKLPGQPGFDQAKWDAWRAALRRTSEALAKMQQVTGKAP